MRKRLFVKPALQFKHMLATLALVIGCFSLSYFLFEAMMASAVIKNRIGPDEWFAMRGTMRMGISLILATTLLAVLVENVLFFHTVVGPLHAIEKGLAGIAAGEGGRVSIREGDQLKDLAAAYEDMRTELFKRVDAEGRLAAALDADIKALAASPSAEGIRSLRDKLKTIPMQSETKTP